MVTQPATASGQPSQHQIQAMQQQLAAEASRHNMTVEQYINHLKAHAMKQAQQQQAKKQQAKGREEKQQLEMSSGGPPDPKALALAKWLRGQDLKTRACILNGQRKDMFKVKRALRALQSPEYGKARAKDPSLPAVTDRTSAENVFKLLPRSLLALRVSKIDPHEGHGHGKPKKRVKGLWTVKIEQHQEVQDPEHYLWLYEGPQWKQKLYAVAALVVIMALVLFPLWPIKLRIGVWYLSMAMLGVIGLFFAMSLFRLVLFCATVFTVPPGLWLYPNLFEDVGFFDSFRPVWGWHEDKKTMKKNAKAAKESSKKRGVKSGDKGSDAAPQSSKKPSTSNAGNNTRVSVAPSPSQSAARVSQRDLAARVEEVEDD
ncbi:MAG: Translocation protein S62 [Lichina confinis]|nr:MAG: Translocation protein S62 [Lichina confinis]